MNKRKLLYFIVTIIFIFLTITILHLTNLSNNVDLIDTLSNDTGTTNIKISANILRGNPYNWNYQVVAIKDGEVSDFIENKNKKDKLFKLSPIQISMYNYIN